MVDAAAALASNDLQNNVYLIDNQKSQGSRNEGQAELSTECQDGQSIRWRVEAISPDNKVDIQGFSGQIINQNVCNPQKTGINGDVFWEGTVETKGAKATYQYSTTLSIDNKAMTFDPFIVVQ